MGAKNTRPVRHIYVGQMPEVTDPEIVELLSRIDIGQEGPPEPPNWKGEVVYGHNLKFASNRISTSKYSCISFLPKMLYLEMKRLLNLYYLVVIGIQVSLYILEFEIPFHEILSNAVPFVLIHIITAIKEACEDCSRRRLDYLVNNRMVNIVVNGVSEEIKAEDLKVGMIVRVQRREHVPADLLIIGTSDPLGRFQISTANIDGETHIKTNCSPSGFPNVTTNKFLGRMNCLLEYQKPSSDVRACNGWLIALSSEMKFLSDEEEEEDPLIVKPKHLCLRCTIDNMALKGTVIKNTACVYGIVVYTGKDTRFAMNTKNTGPKFGIIERSINFILIYMIFFVVLLVAGCTVISFLNVRFARERSVLDQSKKVAWYLYPEPDRPPITHTILDILEVAGQYLFLFNHIIPVNLYIYIELEQMLGSKFFTWDQELKCPETDEPAISNTSDINEELGQIQYLFMDKTGTLTRNELQLRHLSIEGYRYTIKEDDTLWRVGDENTPDEPVDPMADEGIVKFLRVIALCHSVHVVPKREEPHVLGNAWNSNEVAKDIKATTSLEEVQFARKEKFPMSEFLGDQEYEGTSQDEKALLEACCKLGVIYLGEKDKIMSLEVNGKIEQYKRHFVLEFEAARRCMSVLIEDLNGDIWLLSKGDDYAVFPKCKTGKIRTTARHTQDFVALGMRTMGIVKKQINQAGLQAFSHQLKEGRNLLDFQDRFDAIHLLYSKIESNFHVVGGTGIEDHLQDHVEETIEILSDAGIRLWILTGDKVSTAVQAAVACEFIKPGWKLFYATDHPDKETVEKTWRDIEAFVSPADVPVFVVDGDNLDIGMKVCPSIVKGLIVKANRVICCHMTPLQKARVVTMIKTSDGRPRTAACGDGANDVAMIQEAHVGIGIFGREGRQAVRMADFALPQFASLRKAILVHGHWYYVRLATLTNYCFYKSTVFTLPQVFYCYDSGFSGQHLYSTFCYTIFCVVFTALPIFFYGLLDQPHDSTHLMEFPFLYKELTRNRFLNWKHVLLWHVTGIYHACVIYFVPRFAWIYNVNADLANLGAFGTLVFSCVFAVVNLKIFQFTRYLTWIHWFTQFITYAVFIALFAVLSEVNLSSIEFFETNLRGLYFTVLVNYEFWLLMAFVIALCLVPDFIVQSLASYISMFGDVPQEDVFFEPVHNAVIRPDVEDDDEHGEEAPAGTAEEAHIEDVDVEDVDELKSIRRRQSTVNGI